MIFLTLPLMLMLLVPVILVEGFLCKKWLGLSTWEAMKWNAVSNALSTVLGVPMVWLIMLGLELATSDVLYQTDTPLINVISLLLSAAWIGPPDEKTAWTVPFAILVLLVPFFLVSYGIEYLVLGLMVGMPEGGPPNLAYDKVRLAVRNANLVTYGVMFLATSIWLVFSLPHHSR
ncbi:MAG TPA: hypothetical protein VEJ47_05815 [Candidatus Eremiobacteraceae bacterium]|nr:hypothetical protein [Candidatus Eremiobacteraceae bacterium]